MKTRKQYMNGECTHSEYYAQFVSKWQIEQVKKTIGLDRIKSSKDAHFNDIPLKEWDRIGISSAANDGLISAGDGYSLAAAVCINKEAARQIKNI